MNAPRVSVVVAAYNAEATLEETLASVAAQTYHDFELIVIDDGSNDTTPFILEKHARRWPWMSWIRQDNAGAAEAREHGVSLARGDFIAFLDADDLWLPHKLAAQMRALDSNPSIDLVYADAVDFLPGRDAHQTLFQQKPPARGVVLRQLFIGNFIYTCCVLVRKSALRAVGGFDRRHRVNEDVDLWLRLAENYNFDYVDDVLARRRILPTSLMHANSLSCQRRDLEIIDYWVDRRPDLFPPDSPQVRQRRSVIYSRMGRTLLSKRAFAESRSAYRQSFKLGRRDPGTIMLALAAYLPPVAHLFWFAKSTAMRLRKS